VRGGALGRAAETPGAATGAVTGAVTGAASDGPPAAPDATDRAIIRELAADARLSVRALASRLPLSRSAINSRIATLVRTGVLRSFTVTVDRRALGLAVDAVIMVQVDQGEPDELANALASIPYVESVLALTGGSDFLVTVHAPDTEWLSRVVMHRIRNTPGVRATRSHLVLGSAAGHAPWGEASGRPPGAGGPPPR
jgi:DNA-binding Lrp family transcriptional regulator